MPGTFDERAEWFDEHYATTRGRVRLSLLLERLIEMLPPPPARILDAGGGSGRVAVSLAERGYQVTLLDPSEGMLRVARDRIKTKNVTLPTISGRIEDAPSLAPGPYDVICCHAVLMYVDDPRSCLGILRSISEEGALLSLLEKNRDALAIRPDEEALRVLDDPIAAGNLGIQNRARTVDEWRELLSGAGWRTHSWVGVRLFSDVADDDLTSDRFEQLLQLEREAGVRHSYRSVARLVHIRAVAV